MTVPVIATETKFWTVFQQQFIKSLDRPEIATGCAPRMCVDLKAPPTDSGSLAVDYDLGRNAMSYNCWPRCLIGTS